MVTIMIFDSFITLDDFIDVETTLVTIFAITHCDYLCDYHLSNHMMPYIH